MEESYQIFASAILAVCPADFDEGVLVANLAEGYSNIRYDCKSGNMTKEGLPSELEQDLKVDDALHDLRKSMTIPGENPWSRCTFTLFPDGKFKFDVEYDD